MSIQSLIATNKSYLILYHHTAAADDKDDYSQGGIDRLIVPCNFLITTANP